MASFSSPSNIYTDTPNSTFMTASYPPPEADYTIYCKEALILLFLLAGGVISGFAALTRAVRSLAHPIPEQCCCSGCHSHVHDVEVGPATSPLDEPDFCEGALEVDSTELAQPEAAHVSNHDAGEQTPFPSDTEHLSSPPSREKKTRKLWKRVQTAMSNGGWATAMNVAAVTVGCALSGPPTVQCNLPAPATESRRSR